MYGTEVIAAHTIAMNIWLFSAFFIDGYANAGNAMSGMYLGKKQFGLLNALCKKLSYLALGVGGLLSLVYLMLYPYLVNWFTPDTSVHVVFKSVFWLIILSQPINAIAFIYDGIFKGLGEARFLRDVLFYSTVFAFIPVIVISHYNNWNITGVWLAFLVWMIIRALLPMLKFKKQFGSYRV